MERYVTFLRGINVGGHHKLPMAELKLVFNDLGFQNTTTLLNSGNAIFDAPNTNIKKLEDQIGAALEHKFGFPVPTIVRTASFIQALGDLNPFETITVTKDIRLYVSFLQEDTNPEITLPWSSVDQAYQILSKIEQTIISVLDVSITNTPKAMEALEKFYGKGITTRNWNTITKILQKI